MLVPLIALRLALALTFFCLFIWAPYTKLESPLFSGERLDKSKSVQRAWPGTLA